MRKNYKLFTLLFLLAFTVPTYAQNVLDNLRLADKWTFILSLQNLL